MISKKFILILFLVLLIPVGFIILKNIVFNSGNKNQEISERGQENIPDGNQNINLPDNFPKDFPVFEKSTLMAANSNKDKIEGMSAIWEATSTVGEVLAFYQNNLLSNGWKVNVESQEENFVTISVVKDNISGFIAISKGEENKVVISVALGLK
ncbi:hypothetical protein A2V55_00510 [Candidatus Woesebacteria bacterium RBG_19FT_COMBO_37_29]|nr:MAG: hypothetical protein A2V55_00510 [Candidatus Woesebacteria bacterium RBG_19FT_COMBO_37_29]